MENGVYALPAKNGAASSQGIEVKDGMGRGMYNGAAINLELTPGWEPRSEWAPLNDAQAQYLGNVGLAACQTVKA